ncbi:MAG: hypothetical protein Q7R87_03760 [Nanoarchaeota archaeon]|nr:hypothetical protein [Nanoarchaeota archaeon]
MSYEYVRLTDSEVTYAKKHLLNIELESLTSIKKLQNYRDFRNKELTLKVSLKSSLLNLHEQLIVLDKLLPHTSWDKKEMEEMTPSIHMSEDVKIKEKKDYDLENQLEEIRRKLARLQ